MNKLTSEQKERFILVLPQLVNIFNNSEFHRILFETGYRLNIPKFFETCFMATGVEMPSDLFINKLSTKGAN